MLIFLYLAAKSRIVKYLGLVNLSKSHISLVVEINHTVGIVITLKLVNTTHAQCHVLHLMHVMYYTPYLQ